MMSSNQTNEVDPGDSATDLTSPMQDETNEHAHTTGVTDHTTPAQYQTASTDDGLINNGDALFPGGQTADEQNLEVDVCCLTHSDGGYMLAQAEKRLTVYF
jgi:hypothetical protein